MEAQRNIIVEKLYQTTIDPSKLVCGGFFHIIVSIKISSAVEWHDKLVTDCKELYSKGGDMSILCSQFVLAALKLPTFFSIHQIFIYFKCLIPRKCGLAWKS